MQKHGVKYLVPSTGTQEKLANFHGISLKSEVVKLKVSPAQSEPIQKKLESLHIILVGHTSDTRKKHSEILAATVLAQQKATNLENARPINLCFIGVGDNPIGREIQKLGNFLSARNSFISVDKISFAECSLLLGKSNVVVSLTANESFALYVAESMSGGAVVLRTEAGGTTETLENGLNGFKITDSVEDLAEKILFLADKDKFTNDDFETMMSESKRLVQPYLDANYDRVLALLEQ
jgi:glycosyltransferase involved in cell wall biosynthesis